MQWFVRSLNLDEHHTKKIFIISGMHKMVWTLAFVSVKKKSVKKHHIYFTQMNNHIYKLFMKARIWNMELKIRLENDLKNCEKIS